MMGLAYDLQNTVEAATSLLVDSAGEKAAIDNQGLASDERGCIGSKVDCCANQLFRFSEAAHGSAHEQFLSTRSAVKQLRVELGAKDAGGDSVDGDTLF